MSVSKRRSAEEGHWLKVVSVLNEYQARLFVADKALDLGRGGISRMSALTGMSRTTITQSRGGTQSAPNAKVFQSDLVETERLKFAHQCLCHRCAHNQKHCHNIYG
jgi:hypothetical protein